MRMLVDSELVRLLEDTKPFISDVKKPNDWFESNSPVQPCSIDLHIGDIFLPETKPGKRGSDEKPCDEYILKAGGTAVVTTLETIAFSSNLTAIAFPPSRVSFKGLLMTNPGAIDPGYHGKLRFTLINMAQEGYTLRKSELIITLCVFDLEREPEKDFRQRREGGVSSSSIQKTLERLSADFLDVQKRAKKEAQHAVLKAGFLATIFVALVGLAVPYLNTRLSKSDDLEAIRKDISRIRDELWKRSTVPDRQAPANSQYQLNAPPSPSRSSLPSASPQN